MNTRRGTTILELMVAGALVGALLVGCLRLFSATAAQRRMADQRKCAVCELSNVMERVAAKPWADLTPETLDKESVSPSAARQLPGAQLKIEVVAPAKELDAKRITASLRWPGAAGQPSRPVVLSTWRYK